MEMLGLSACIYPCTNTVAWLAVTSWLSGELTSAQSTLFISSQSSQPSSAGSAVSGEPGTEYAVDQGTLEINLALLISRLFIIFSKFCVIRLITIVMGGKTEDGSILQARLLAGLLWLFC